MPRLTEPQVIEDLLLFRLSRLLAVGGAPIIRLCEGLYGITRREWRMLALLAHEGELGSSELAQRAQLDRARTSRVLSSLADKGLLTRASGLGDRRRVTVALTAAGRSLVAEFFPRAVAVNAALLQALPGADVQRLDRLLDVLQARADALANDPAQRALLPKADRRKGGRRIGRNRQPL